MWDVIETLLPYVATGIIGYLSRYLQERRGRSHEAKQNHFAEIKQQVFQPLLQQLNEYYKPILERKRVNIKWSRELLT